MLRDRRASRGRHPDSGGRPRYGYLRCVLLERSEMTVVTLAGLRRLVENLEGVPGDAPIDLTRLDQRFSTTTYDSETDIYIDVRFDLEDLADDKP